MPNTTNIKLIPWHGDKMPVPYGTLVIVKHRNKQFHLSPAGKDYAADWSIEKDMPRAGDIIAYTPITIGD